MSQSEVFHETWAYLRDHAKGISQEDAIILAELRAPMPPSRAHIKRIQRKALQSPISIKRPAGPPDRSARAHKCEAIKFGMLVKRKLMPNTMAPASPLPRQSLPPIPPCERAPAPARVNTGDKLRRDHMVALAKMAKRKYDFDVAEVLEVFGSADAFFRAINS